MRKGEDQTAHTIHYTVSVSVNCNTYSLHYTVSVSVNCNTYTDTFFRKIWSLKRKKMNEDYLFSMAAQQVLGLSPEVYMQYVILIVKYLQHSTVKLLFF